MSEFFQCIGILACCVLAAVALFGCAWIVFQVIETREKADRCWKENYQRGNDLSDRIWTEHHRVSAIEAELIKCNSDIHNLKVNMGDRDKLGTQFLADLKSLQHQLDAHRKHRHSDDEAEEQKPAGGL